jgi:alpha-glucosidase
MATGKYMKKWFVVVALTVGQATLALAAPATLVSPDGSIVLNIERDASRFSIMRHGEMVIEPSPLGLELENAPALDKLELVKRKDVKVKRSVPLVATKASSALDHYKGTTLRFRESTGAKRHLLLDLRAYNDGVAFRYRLETPRPVSLRNERTAFIPAGDPSCLFTPAHGAHEEAFARLKLSQLPTDTGYDVPVVCASPSGKTAFAITQAYLEGYTGSSFMREGQGLRVHLSPVPNHTGAAFESPAGLRTAWRVVMMGDRAGDLIESHLIGNLNPDAKGDFSWVKPGKAAWDWWSGPLEGMKPDMAAYRRFIDFAAEGGFPYYLIDAGWAWGANSEAWRALPETDITRAGKGINMEELVRYAQSKGVDLILWAHWQHVAARMDEVLDTYARWGIKGVKIDFMNRDDQEVVDFYQRVVAATAKRHLLLDLHGAFVPAGLQRTYPNYITQEGVLGAEWHKMTARVTPEHNLILPYTRMLAGPMDYTPGGFRHAAPGQFKVQAIMPLTQNTRGQALAMYVVYDSPLQMVSDDPEAYRNAAGFDFIRRVPTAWDETRFLSGEPGRDIVLARRQGNTWYLGAMRAGEKGQHINQSVRLGFLSPGRYRAEIWEDGDAPDTLQKRELDVTAKDELKLQLAPAGGAAVILRPRP